MARKQFVSSKKNAPNRGIPSKESAMHERDDSAGDELNDGSDVPLSPGSATSDVSSSVLSADENDTQDVNDEEDDEPAVLDVKVIPSTVGRGKQLRFPVVSKGKESRVVNNNAEYGSDSESYASIDSDAEMEAEAEAEDDEDKPSKNESLNHVETQPKVTSSPQSQKKHHQQDIAERSSNTILKAKKRHRPNSDYTSNMSCYVRDCLLSIRNNNTDQNSKEIFSDEYHEEFRKKLKAGNVSRISSENLGSESKPQQKENFKAINDKEKKNETKIEKKDRNKPAGSINNKNVSVDEDSAKPPPKQEKKENSSSSSSSSSTCAVCQHHTNLKKRSNESSSTFVIPINVNADIQKLRSEATKLNEEARALKHQGNRKGSSSGSGLNDQVAQSIYYIKSSAKFFQHALKLAEIKAAYKAIDENQHARTYGEYCITTLSQTCTLIETTTRAFQNAGKINLVALSYKFSSIVHLTVYRLEHLKLFSLYSDLFTPGRSPGAQAGETPTPPPTSGTNDSSNKESTVKSHLLEEMEHIFRGFEMWRRYENCKVNVLPGITDPTTADLSLVFEELNKELEQYKS